MPRADLQRPSLFVSKPPHLLANFCEFEARRLERWVKDVRRWNKVQWLRLPTPRRWSGCCAKTDTTWLCSFTIRPYRNAVIGLVLLLGLGISNVLHNCAILPRHSPFRNSGIAASGWGLLFQADVKGPGLLTANARNK